MKYRTPAIVLLSIGAMMSTGTVLAQNQPIPPPVSPTMSKPTPAPTSASDTTRASTQFNSTQGQVTINSTMPKITAGPAPSFEQLSGGSRYITEEQAAAYPLLANDFLYVDKGHTGHITKSQYERWVSDNR